jgi:hypothetical protein
MTINSSIIEPFLTWSPDAIDVPLANGLRIQILPSLDELYRARRHQYAAFIASEALLVVWEDDPTKLFDRAKKIEDELLQFVWQENLDQTQVEKSSNLSDVDVELGIPAVPERPVVYYDAFLVGCAVCLLMFLVGLGYAEIAQEVVVLKSWTSMLLVFMTPINIFLSLVSTFFILSAILKQSPSFHCLRLSASPNPEAQANCHVVLRKRCHQIHRPNSRPGPANVQELEVLLRRCSSSHSRRLLATCDHSDARL